MNYQEDSYYIKKVLQGDMASYAILIEKHKSMAFTIALRLVKNREDAEEIAQDAFLKAYSSLAGFKSDAKFSTWLFKIVYNTALSRLRKKQLDSTSLENTGEVIYEGSSVVDGLDSLHIKERKKIISEAVGRLKEEESIAITLFYLNENSIKEIEEITGYSNSNIKILLHRGRKKLLFELKKILKEETVDLL